MIIDVSWSGEPIEANLSLPGSKSAAQRALVLAAQGPDPVEITRVPASSDVDVLLSVLHALGVEFDTYTFDERTRESSVRVQPPTSFDPGPHHFEVGLAGTALRFAVALCAASPGIDATFTGPPRMRERPIEDLVSGLNDAGASIEVDLSDEGFRLRVVGRSLAASAGEVLHLTIPGRASSQHPSAALLAVPSIGLSTEVHCGETPSRPYLDWTLRLIREFGGVPMELSPGRIRLDSFVPRHDSYRCEGDISGGSAFAALAAVTDGHVRLSGVDQPLTGELSFIAALDRSGCRVVARSLEDRVRQLSVQGTRRLRAFSFDARSAIDSVPALAVVAAFASGTSKIDGIASLRGKESDRVDGIRQIVESVGARMRVSDDRIEIDGAPPSASRMGGSPTIEIDPRGDHRLAMAGALLAASGRTVRILDSSVARKSMPQYWSFLTECGLEIRPARVEREASE